MDIAELLTKFVDPLVIKTLPLTQRLIAAFFITIMGMGITFLALIILQIIIGAITKFSSHKEAVVKDSGLHGQKKGNDAELNEEEVAAITTALALQLGTSVDKIVIRNIEKTKGGSSWQKAGLRDQLNDTL